MKLYKFFWDTHKWTGIILSALMLGVSGTGLLLLWKKNYDWIQPPTQKGAAGDPADFISLQRLFEVTLASGSEYFQSADDIARVDFRPKKRMFKVLAERDNRELQVDAITGQILQRDGVRRSDFIEAIHDGSYFGDWFKEWVMPVAPFGLAFLVFSGLYLWLQPALRKRRRRKMKDRARSTS